MTAKRLRVSAELLRDGLARLADVAPAEFVILTEESDWGLVGGDLRAAIESTDEDPTLEDREELVEA